MSEENSKIESGEETKDLIKEQSDDVVEENEEQNDKSIEIEHPHNEVVDEENKEEETEAQPEETNNEEDYQEDEQPQEENTNGQDEYYEEAADDTSYNPNVIAWGTTIYSCEAQTEEELSFQEGEVIGILEEHEDGWSKGELHGVQGLFPTNYVQRSDYEEEAPNGTGSDGQASAVLRPKDPEAAKRRKEERQQLKDEMKDVKDEIEKQTKAREDLEKEVTQLTAKAQKLNKDLYHLKSDMSDKNSLMFDLLKLLHSIDVHSDAVQRHHTPEQTLMDGLISFVGDLSKEAKSSAPLATFATKLNTKVKEMKTLVDASNVLMEEGSKCKTEFKPELESLIRVLDEKGKKGEKGEKEGGATLVKDRSSSVAAVGKTEPVTLAKDRSNSVAVGSSTTTNGNSSKK